HRMDGALTMAVHRDARLVGAGLIGEVANRRLGARGVDAAHDVVRPALVRPEAGLAGADLVVAQGRDAETRKLFGQLAHVADGTDDGVVAVAVGRPAFGDQHRRGSRPGALLVAVGAVDGQAVGVEADVVVDPGMLLRRAAGQRQHQQNGQNDNAFQRRTSIHDATSSSTTARSGSLNTSWYSSG